MRTTLTIEESLLEKARAVSQERACTLGEVIEDALRVTLLAQPKAPRTALNRPLKTFRGTGLQPGIDLAASGALLDAMDGR